MEVEASLKSKRQAETEGEGKGDMLDGSTHLLHLLNKIRAAKIQHYNFLTCSRVRPAGVFARQDKEATASAKPGF